MEARLIERVAQELGLTQSQVQVTVELLEQGCTIPFIARYRKERTSGLDEVQLRLIQQSAERVAKLEERRRSVFASLDEQGVLDASLRRDIEDAATLVALEDLYAPYRPKRKTRASKALDAGLGPLLQALLRDEPITSKLAGALCPDFPDEAAVLGGVKDIYAEHVSDQADVREHVRLQLRRRGVLSCKKRRGAQDNPTFEGYLDFSSPLERLRPHQVLAIRRGDAEKALSFALELQETRALDWIKRRYNTLRHPAHAALLDEAIEDGYERLLLPALSREVWAELELKADAHAIHVFALNLKNLLLQPPMSQRRVMGIDPGYRTGCKIAVIDERGELLATEMIYIHDGRSKAAPERLKALIQRHGVALIAIGNGTASRETEEAVAQALRALTPGQGQGQAQVQYALVSEAGASVYSASELARAELPDLDVSVRGAVSIARRLQDPLAELVKIDPRSIGVGMYQHDVNQAQLERSLDAVVEDVVNAVGVDLNTASPALLTRISGIGPKLAAKIVEHRASVGAFQTRAQLLKVKGLGAKTFEQCAGFLRIPSGQEPLDQTAIHPERYPFAREVLKALGAAPGAELEPKLKLERASIEALASRFEVGPLTLRDILDDLVRPGRDPRQELDSPQLRSDVLSLEDLREGMRLSGTVRNVVDFGAFVDLGVKQDGLVHISELSDRFVSDPHEVVAVGDRVQVTVLSVDLKRGRVALSMKR